MYVLKNQIQLCFSPNPIVGLVHGVKTAQHFECRVSLWFLQIILHNINFTQFYVS